MKVNNCNSDKSNKNALIIFTREPEPGKTKTRMMPYLSPEQCAELHRCMLRDISKETGKVNARIIVAYRCGEETNFYGEPSFLKKCFGKKAIYIRQRGENIGERMQNAISNVLERGFKNVVLIGTDIPEITSDAINKSFRLLLVNDVVFGPTEDGGYYLIGMKKIHVEAFSPEMFVVSDVLEKTLSCLTASGLKTEKTETYSDMDVPSDLAGYRNRMRRSANLRKTCTGRFLSAHFKISIIVPVFNEIAQLNNICGQIIQDKNDCEFIFVDGGSTDGTREVLSVFAESNKNVFFIPNEEKGRAVQMNSGARMSTGDILFFLHCDSTLPDDFINEIRRVMSLYDWGCFRLSFSSKNFFMWTNSLFSNQRALWRRLPFGDQGIFIDRALFFEAGMFPEVPLMEDYEFSMKMRHQNAVRGPGISRKKLTTSGRRYGIGTASIIKTEIQMWKLRHMYRSGVDPWVLRSMYEDIR